MALLVLDSVEHVEVVQAGVGAHVARLGVDQEDGLELGALVEVVGDALEDDTGMVTEQISDEDTLLSEDVATPAKAARPAPAARAARPAAMAAGPTEKEPGWVTAVAIVSFLVFVWATMVHYSISQDQNPKESMFTSAWSG